ncbi:SGNH/GDSL hydrolase family protein [bacterium]|nr:SGNH/GDSL hydrolase family protein [bacterium]
MKKLLQTLISALALGLFGIVLSLGILEVGFRVVQGLASPPKSWSDRPEAYYNPRAAETLQGNLPLRPKREEVFRLAVIGDSFTFAPFMQPDDAFPAKLERIFQMSLSSDMEEYSDVEVRNYGVPGYSTSHEVQEARKAITEGADALLLQITLNDPQRKSYQPTGLTGQNEFGPYVPPQRFAHLLSWWRSANFFLERFHNTETHRRYQEYYFRLFESEASWKSFDNSLNRMAKVARRNEVPLFAVVFPLFGVPLDANYPFHPLHEKVRGALEQREIPTLDLFSAYEGIPLSRLQVIPGGDFHPNEIGHRIAAEQIYEWLRVRDRSLEESETGIPSSLLQTPRMKTRTDIRLLASNTVEPSE